MDVLTPRSCRATAAHKKIRLELFNPAGDPLEIWRREGDTKGWELIACTTDDEFIDGPVKPGQYYEYRTRKIEGESVSAFSPSTVVYGR